MRFIGLDPGLRHTGWGVIEQHNNNLHYVAHGVINPPTTLDLAQRLDHLFQELSQVIDHHKPHHAAVEETFVNNNPTSTLKLGMARGIALLTPARFGLPVAEYKPNTVKKTIVGVGHAGKEQVQRMIKLLLPACSLDSADAADALAIAICHAHHSRFISLQII